MSHLPIKVMSKNTSQSDLSQHLSTRDQMNLMKQNSSRNPAKQRSCPEISKGIQHSFQSAAWVLNLKHFGYWLTATLAEGSHSLAILGCHIRVDTRAVAWHSNIIIWNLSRDIIHNVRIVTCYRSSWQIGNIVTVGGRRQ